MEGRLEIDVSAYIIGAKKAQLVQVAPTSFHLYVDNYYWGSMFKQQGKWVRPERLPENLFPRLVQILDEAVARDRLKISFKASYGEEKRMVYIYQTYYMVTFEIYLQEYISMTTLLGRIIRRPHGWELDLSFGLLRQPLTMDDVQALGDIIDEEIAKKASSAL